MTDHNNVNLIREGTQSLVLSRQPWHRAFETQWGLHPSICITLCLPSVWVCALLIVCAVSVWLMLSMAQCVWLSVYLSCLSDTSPKPCYGGGTASASVDASLIRWTQGDTCVYNICVDKSHISPPTSCLSVVYQWFQSTIHVTAFCPSHLPSILMQPDKTFSNIFLFSDTADFFFFFFRLDQLSNLDIQIWKTCLVSTKGQKSFYCMSAS